MSVVQTKIVDSVATIVLDRPERHNALDAALIAELQQAFSDVHQEKRVAAVVLTGKGQDFCSGVDLKSFAQIGELPEVDAPVAWLEAWRELTELCESLLRFPKPIVAAIDGAAVGAGLAIALASDLIVMSDRATLQASAVNRGLLGGVTGPLLNFRFGGAIAARMLLTGEAIDASEAHRLGMSCQVISSDQIWVAANQWATRCTQGPHESIQATKRMINETIGETLLMHLANGAAIGATVCSTESASEGIQAFLDKREPQWP